MTKRLSKPIRRSARPSKTGKALFELFWQLPFTYFRLNAMGHRLSAPAGLSPGKIGLMRSLAAAGPQSVAQIARSRPVSRQGVQQIADHLAAAGLIEYIENPTHRRAKLARITAAGERLMRRMLQRQQREAAALSKGFDERAVRTTIAVLRQLSERLKQAAEAG